MKKLFLLFIASGASSALYSMDKRKTQALKAFYTAQRSQGDAKEKAKKQFDKLYPDIESPTICAAAAQLLPETEERNDTIKKALGIAKRNIAASRTATDNKGGSSGYGAVDTIAPASTSGFELNSLKTQIKHLNDQITTLKNGLRNTNYLTNFPTWLSKNLELKKLERELETALMLQAGAEAKESVFRSAAQGKTDCKKSLSNLVKELSSTQAVNTGEDPCAELEMRFVQTIATLFAQHEPSPQEDAALKEFEQHFNNAISIKRFFDETEESNMQKKLVAQNALLEQATKRGDKEGLEQIFGEILSLEKKIKSQRNLSMNLRNSLKILRRYNPDSGLIED